jgi:hypothetical protein
LRPVASETEKKKRVSRQQDVPLPEAPRNYAPRGIAALLAPVVRPAFRKRAPAAAQLLADWRQLAGSELYAHATPLKFAGGTLTLGCTGPTAMELQMTQAQIIERLNLALGQKLVERLRFLQQTPSIATPSRARLAPAAIEPPADLPEGPLGEALAALYRGMKSRS